MYLLLNMGIFQPAILVYQRVIPTYLGSFPSPLYTLNNRPIFSLFKSIQEVFLFHGKFVSLSWDPLNTRTSLPPEMAVFFSTRPFLDSQIKVSSLEYSKGSFLRALGPTHI